MKAIVVVLFCLPRIASAQLVFPPDGGDILAYNADGSVATVPGLDGGNLPIFDLDHGGQLIVADSLTVLGKGTQGYPELNGDGQNLYSEANPIGNTFTQWTGDSFSTFGGEAGSGNVTALVIEDLYSTLLPYVSIGITPSGDGGNGFGFYSEVTHLPLFAMVRDDGRITALTPGREPGDVLLVEQLCAATTYGDGGAAPFCIEDHLVCGG